MPDNDRIDLAALERDLRAAGWTWNATDYIIKAVREYMDHPGVTSTL